jgi:hypothetical protein
MNQESDSILNIVNGDAVASLLGQTNLPGQMIAWRDVLHEGPVPGGIRREELRRVRSNFLAAQGWATYYGTLTDLTERDQLLENYRQGAYVLWFEADLYDQLQLCQVFDTLRQLSVAPQQISLICIGEFPGIQRFIGLSQLLPQNLVQLYARRRTCNEATIAAASAAWRTFCGGDPTQLLRLGEDIDKDMLPFLSEALTRLAQEYPSTANGLSLSQQRILSVLANKPVAADRLFKLISDQEKRPYLSDTTLYAYVDGLVNARYPLVKAEDSPAPVAKPKLFITATGSDVLGNSQDHIALNGIDKWIGGVHLQSGSPGWRYNESLAALMSSIL